jgi:heptosyltransferase-2
MWPLERFVELGAALARGGAGEERRLVVFDAPRERGRAAAVHAGLLVAGVDAGFVPAGPLEAFIACAANLDLLVCNDSGVMHVAAALGVPTVSFHALGRPEEWAPSGDRAAAFHAERIAEIAVAPALEAAERLLGSARA